MYLAWHYTGQTWGMVAAFAHVEGIRFDKAARGLVTANLRTPLAWHAVWAVHGVAAKGALTGFALVYEIAGAAAVVSSALGALGLWRVRRACGRLPLRVLVPWVAVHCWYALLYHHPKALFWIQLSHALQYLIFPLRVQANRQEGRGDERAPPARDATYYALLTASGFLAFQAAPHLANQAAAWAGASVPAAVLVIDLLNIHRYLVDGCIWKSATPRSAGTYQPPRAPLTPPARERRRAPPRAGQGPS